MTKRKYDDCFAAEDSFDKIVTDNDENKNYKAAMNFVAKFKKEREKEGKRMDWAACFGKGQGLLNYKNTSSLRAQFYKYKKEKAKK